MKIVRTVTVDRPMAEVFAYLSDFTTTEEWDPAPCAPPGRAATAGSARRYRNVSRFLGRETELTYVVTEHQPPHAAAAARREQDRRRARHDDADAGPAAAPSSPTGRSSSSRAGPGWWRRSPAPALRRLGDEAADGAQRALACAGS